MKRTLDFKNMVKDINRLVDTDFVADMEMHFLPGDYEYTQEEAQKMSRLLSRVYSISHAIYCEACGSKYDLSPHTKE